MHWKLFVVAVLVTGCRTQGNYTTIEGPRYHGEPPPHIAPASARDTIRIASFNIEFALRIDSALAVLETDSALSKADIVLLQEMDAPSTRYVARELGMWFIYYPATRHFKHRRDFGNAVLSRWPIIDDSKIILPYPARFHGNVRIATAATIKIDTMVVRVYSVHLGTIANNTRSQRAEQLEAIMEDAEPYTRVILGGDMNDASIGEVAVEKGYAWPTKEGPRTALIGRLDHIFVRGLFIPDSAAAGTVRNNRNSSDHLPVWAVALVR